MPQNPSPKLTESLAELRDQGVPFLAVTKLAKWAKNPNRHQPGVPQLLRIIQRYGWTVPLIVRRDVDDAGLHEISAGHGRLLAAAGELGLTEVPVIFRNFSEHESHAYGLADNKAPEFSMEDEAALKVSIDELLADDGLTDVLDAGYTEDELIALGSIEELPDIPSEPGAGSEPQDKETAPDRPGDDDLPDKVEAVSKVGDDVEVGRHRIVVADCLDVLKALPDCSVDSIVTDPPYGIGFMGKGWDVSVPGIEWARECLRVLKPGGHIIAFAATRTVHRLGTIIEDAGFEIRDQIEWLQYQGFPKSLDVSRAIDAAAGAEREVVGKNPSYRADQVDAPSFSLQRNPNITAPATDDAKTWDGWGTGLKPSHEPAVLARKPLSGTVVETVLEHGTGALNIEGCRIPYGDKAWPGPGERHEDIGRGKSTLHGPHSGPTETVQMHDGGRFPANVYMCPKPARSERSDGVEGEAGNSHPTVKPVGLMRWLVRLVTPPGGTVLEPFLGSGTTLVACEREGFVGIGVEASPEYADIALARVRKAVADA